MKAALELAKKFGPKVVEWVKKNWWWLSTLAWEALKAAIDAASKLF